MKKFFSILLVFTFLLPLFGFAQAEIRANNPLIDPQTVKPVKTEKEYFNLLILGIDFSDNKSYRMSGGRSSEKADLSGCHTDAIMVISVDIETGTVRFISLPRDTVTYVPGVQGLYKLNAAFNCADNIDQGLKNIVNASSWLLGGIEIDAYVAVDVDALITLCDTMGGLDYDMDMAYHSGSRYYQKGMQHLDGQGIFDYVRARKNATDNVNDITRTNRQRKMMMAIVSYLKANPKKVVKLWAKAMSGDINCFTDLTGRDYKTLYSFFTGMDHMSLESYVLNCNLHRTLDWNFNFPYLAERLEMLKNLFGIDAYDLPYSTNSYAEWLKAYGFTNAKRIHVARDIYAYCKSIENKTEEEQQLTDALDQAIDAAVLAYDAESLQRNGTNLDAMEKAVSAMMHAADKAAEKCGYPAEYRWYLTDLWYKDPAINAWNQINWN